MAKPRFSRGLVLLEEQTESYGPWMCVNTRTFFRLVVLAFSSWTFRTAKKWFISIPGDPQYVKAMSSFFFVFVAQGSPQSDWVTALPLLSSFWQGEQAGFKGGFSKRPTPFRTVSKGKRRDTGPVKGHLLKKPRRELALRFGLVQSSKP